MLESLCKVDEYRRRVAFLYTSPEPRMRVAMTKGESRSFETPCPIVVWDCDSMPSNEAASITMMTRCPSPLGCDPWRTICDLYHNLLQKRAGVGRRRNSQEGDLEYACSLYTASFRKTGILHLDSMLRRAACTVV